MNVAIRNAGAEDRDACVALLEALRGDADGIVSADEVMNTFMTLLMGERGAIYVAHEGDQILGMATVSFNLALRYGGEYCQLEELIVTPQARGKNVGGLLVQATVEAARARGCGEFGLYLVEHTEHNRPFYEKYGFVAVGTEMRQILT
jgi:GNAT superfamily N-acetyltransferase